MQAKNITPEKKDFSKSDKVEHKKHLNYMRDKHREKTRGKFIFHEVPGGIMEFTFREFEGEKPERYTMRDGEVYEVPLGVAKHLNKNCWYPIYQHVPGETTQAAYIEGYGMKVGTKVRRCSFQSLEFLEEDISPTPSLITVEKA